MKIGFMTLGYSNWMPNPIDKRGDELGLVGDDFRGCPGKIGTTRLPEFAIQAEKTQR